jgi:membrane protein involved in colicin uptake
MSTAVDSARHDAELKALETVKTECRKLVETMRVVPPSEAERIKQRLEDAIKRCDKLPMEFKRQLLTDARSFECIANTRAADTALQSAMGKARLDDANERNRLVAQAREFANKAASLGADASFKATLNRKIEIIMMTGKVQHKGPTAAKPLNIAPKPNGAKS